MAKTLEKNLDKVSQEVSEAVEDVKETMSDVGGRWKKSSWEEKVTTFVGIILLLRGLWKLRTFVRGILLLILGGLLVSGYFNKWLKTLFATKPTKEKAEKVEKVAPAKKPARK
ncbi:MAG: hypothetical protein LBO09_08595 [Candidatus Peribacteria bacterium]|jgi:hypothetical protein|nr:hypothetical protein [Candidatus Peribacteria bacterium]